MGLFERKKKSSKDDAAEQVQHFFDENFREELRNHGRWYFEKVINENGTLFKQDLDATLAQINTELKAHVTAQLDVAIAEVGTELKGHITKQLEDQFALESKALKEAQADALRVMQDSARALQQQHEQLSTMLKQTITDEQTTLSGAFESSKADVAKMKDSQALALQWLAQSIKAIQDQHEQLSQALQKAVADQQTMLVGAFEQNMAQVIEHYLLGALGDQYDLKAQLPSIVKQMEANKQAMMDDIKL